MADGYIQTGTYSKQVGIALQTEDKYILDELVKEINYTGGKISEYKNSFKVRVSSDKMYEDLVKLNFSEDKSRSDYVLPNIPDNLLHHFIRGYFDGDGCVTIKQGQYMSVNICCNSKIFLKSMQEFLNKYDIESKIYNEQGKRKSPLYVLYVTKIINHYKFMNFIYKDSSIYLRRKKVKFDNYEKFNKFKTI